MPGKIPIHVQGAVVTTDRHYQNHQIVEGENKYPKVWGAPLGSQNNKCQMAK